MYKNKYSEHIARWFNLFDKKQILCLIFEEWTTRPDIYLKKIGAFLGCKNPIKYVESEKTKNKGRMQLLPNIFNLNKLSKGNRYIKKLNEKIFTKHGYPELESQTYKYLSDYFDEDNHKLKKMLNMSLSKWRMK